MSPKALLVLLLPGVLPAQQTEEVRFKRDQIMFDEIAAKRVEQAVMIQNASTDVEWFFQFARRCHLCLTKGRINFDREDGGSAANRYGQVFFYYGKSTKAFLDVFGAFGLVGKLEGRGGATVR